MEKKKHGIFNIFDLVLIGIAILLAVVLVISRFAAPGGEQPNTPVGIEQGKVTYVVEFTFDKGEEDLIHVGDRVTDRIKHYNLGVVDAVEVTDAQRSVPDFAAGKIVNATVPGKVTLLVTITGSATATKKGTLVDGGYPLYLGVSVNAVFPGITGVGSVVRIERGQAQ